ncbi:MAG: alpha/beta fold hydrolase [Deltaproteobacteria bacterium]|nr:alpha/beta fold hydrolase [Deltaproteobacteria bacterium]
MARWAKRLRRLGLAWRNGLEIARAGRLTAPYGAPFEVVHEEKLYRLRRYEKTPDAGVTPVRAPLLLVPPLMVASEVYDISPDVSAVAALSRWGCDVWLVDFGRPETEEGGMDRTLDDHVRAVSEAIDRVRTATGHDVHLAGYSQGGMFCYQAAAFRRSAGLASVITMGSPVDLHRTVRLGEDTTERLVAGLRAALSWPLARIEGLPGFFTSTGFKLLSARKEAMQLIDFVKNLHDRTALEKREAKRLFLGGEGFVAWPGPAFRKFVDDLIVGNRMQSGGFVIDGHTVTLSDLTCPILYMLGSRDEMGRPAAVRGIRRASPKVDTMYEITLKAGHFGLVVGSTALTVTWPSVVAWMRWREGAGPLPAAAIDARAPEPEGQPAETDNEDDEAHDESTLDIAREIVEKTAAAALERVSELTEDVGNYLDNARWQVPRLNRLRNLQDDSLISFGRSLSEQADKIGDRTFFLFRGRAFTYADANRRVDAVVRGLIACGIKPGQKIGVMMKSRPSHLTVVCAINRLGAVAVLLSPETHDEMLPKAMELGDTELLITDPDSATRARASIAGKVLVLGGVGEVPWQPGVPRTLPAGVIDMESIDPATVTLPAWYKPDPGRARDLAMVFVSSGIHEPPRATRITNRRWAFSALGAAAAATLTTRDTVYCCLPLHHPSGTLVSAGAALVGGARLALASKFAPTTFWDEIRRYGASVVFYAGEMCRRLVDAQPVLGERNNPVRLFAGSGLRKDVWRRLVDRFGPVGVLELYASTEANAVLANARGKKLGSVGRPLPGSPELAVAAWSFPDDDFERDGAGRLVRSRLDEPGMLVAKLGQRAGADVAHIDPRRVLHDAFEPSDLWFVTGDIASVDTEGDFWLIDRASHMIQTRLGAIASTRIEDALYETPGVALCIAAGQRDPADPKIETPIAALQLQPGVSIEPHLASISAAVAALPEYGRPRRIRVVDSLPLTDGFRPIKRGIRDLDVSDGPGVYAWDARAQQYRPTDASARSARGA